MHVVRTGILDLPAFAPEAKGEVNAIVETPKGSQNKYNYDEETGLFMLGGPMPFGVVFPFEFGFIPSTLGDDGDPLDLVILLDSPTFAGCLVRARVIGVVTADQTEAGKTSRNDRLIGVAVKSRRHENVRELSDLSKTLVSEIEHFFVSYNQIKGKVFKPLGRFGSSRALTLIRQGCKAKTAARKRAGK